MVGSISYDGNREICGLEIRNSANHVGVCQTDAGAVAARRAGSRPGEGCRDSGKGWKKPGRGSQNAAYCKDEAGYAEGAGTHRGSPGALSVGGYQTDDAGAVSRCHERAETDPIPGGCLKNRTMRREAYEETDTGGTDPGHDKAAGARKRVGIVHLEMVRESRTLYGMKRFQNPREAAEMVRPLCEKADREMVLVLSLNGRLEPQAVEIAAVGGISSCNVDIRSLFNALTLLNNAEFVICIHSHPSGDPGPSREDEEITGRIRSAGALLGIELVDHIILGEGDAYYSFRDHGWLCGDGRFPAA